MQKVNSTQDLQSGTIRPDNQPRNITLTTTASLNDSSKKVTSSLRPKKNIPSSRVAVDLQKISNNITKTSQYNTPKTISYRKTANPLDRLCELLLPWNLLEAIKVPTDSLHEKRIIRKIPTRFESHDEYYNVWEPVLLEEIKSNIITHVPQISRNNVKAGTLHIGPGEGTDSSSSLIRLHCTIDCPNHSSSSKSSDSLFSNMDLLILSDRILPIPMTPAELKNFPEMSLKQCILALVTSSNIKDGNKLVIKVAKESWGYVKENTTVIKGIIKLNFVNIDSIVSCWREFMSLHELGINKGLLDQLLGLDHSEYSKLNCDGTVVSEKFDKGENLPGITETLMELYRKQYNSSQLQAIYSTTISDGFVLIQGPPGTGKTSTVLGILNTIHIREYNKYYELVMKAILGREGTKCRHATYKENKFNDQPLLQLITRLAKTKPHILVVAPSNVAVDNIIERIMEKGFYDGQGGRYNPNLLRIGAGKSNRVMSVSLESTLEHEDSFTFQAPKSASLSTIDNLRLEIKKMVEQIYNIQSYLLNLQYAFTTHPLPAGYEIRIIPETAMPYWVNHNDKSTSQNPPELSPTNETVLSNYSLETLPEYQSNVRTIISLIEKLEQSYLFYTRCKARLNPNDYGGSYAARQLIESSIIDSTHIIFTTLNSCGHPSMETTEFVCTIIDEAAQCVEPSVLIALRRGCEKCIMVGDPKQLPATIFSDTSKAAGYDRSLFERLMQLDHPCILLDTQYRMCPIISRFPSIMFYNGLLKDGNNVRSATYCPQFLEPPLNSDNDNDNDNDEPDTLLDHTPIKIMGRFLDESDEDSIPPPPPPQLTSQNTRDRINSVPTPPKLEVPCTMQPKSKQLVIPPPPPPPLHLPITTNYKPPAPPVLLIPTTSKIVTKLPPFLFIDLISSKDTSSYTLSQSRSNIEEAKMCCNVLQTIILEAYHYESKLGSIGMITPYNDQLSEVKKQLNLCGLFSFNKTSNAELNKVTNNIKLPHPGWYYNNSRTKEEINIEVPDIEVGTVDGFQGREKDIVIISCVRANDQGQIGFLSDARRMNVALTRAKYGMYIIGCAETLRHNELWCKLILHAECMNKFICVKDSSSALMSCLIERQNFDSDENSVLPNLHSDDALNSILLGASIKHNRKRKLADASEEEDGEIRD